MFKSFTNQRNAKSYDRTPQQIIIDLPIALPSNIPIDVEKQIFDIIMRTPFALLSMPLTGYSRVVTPDSGRDRKQQKADKTSNIGFVKDFNPATNKFRVLIFDRFAKIVQAFIKPAVEIIYVDSYNGLTRISKFNVIDIEGGNKKDKPIKPSTDKTEKKPNAKAAFPSNFQQPAEPPVEKELKSVVTEPVKILPKAEDPVKEQITEGTGEVLEGVETPIDEPFVSETGPDYPVDLPSMKEAIEEETPVEEKAEIERTAPKPDSNDIGVTIGDLIKQK